MLYTSIVNLTKKIEADISKLENQLVITEFEKGRIYSLKRNLTELKQIIKMFRDDGK
jgi:hypothetical protein